MFKTSNVSKGFPSDRFIPMRSTDNFDYSNFLINNTHEESNWKTEDYNEDSEIVLSALQQYRKQNYISQIKQVMLPHKKRVLEFSNRNSSKVNRKTNDDKMVWPVKSRNKPLLGPPSIVLDMPDMSVGYGRQVVDWGNKGYLAAIHNGDVHFWHPASEAKTHIVKTDQKVKHCIKWNVDGTLLAMSMRNGSIAVWDFPLGKFTRTARCICVMCMITTMVWTRTNELISGCSRGRICHWSSSLTLISDSIVHDGEIMSLKLSRAEYHLGSSGLDYSMKVMVWPSKKILLNQYHEDPVKAFDWHPWRDALLAVGGNRFLSIHNVNTLKSMDSDLQNHSYIDSLCFNPISAELLISKFQPYGADCISSLSVLKSLNCVVDEIQHKYERYEILLWDNTGTKLATASTGENLCLWDFFGRRQQIHHRHLKQKSKSLTTNMFQTLEMFGSKIR